MKAQPVDIEGVLVRLDEMDDLAKATVAGDAKALSAEQLALAELVLETWVLAHEGEPTKQRKEGFRLLALHRQGAKGIPSFNACRETCREIVFQHNVVEASKEDDEQERALRLMTMVVRHLALFVSGKLQVAGLGDFCCASKPLRQPDTNSSALQNL